MNKMDEQVLVFSHCYQTRLSGLPGFASTGAHPNNWDIFVKEVVPNTKFMRRGDVEDDPSMSQVIPYVVIQDLEGRVLVYNRGDKGGEKRLVDKCSIGFGGHINQSDTGTVVHPGPDFLFKAARRELEEELQGINEDTMWNSFVPLGFLYLFHTQVDAVHFGAVLEAICRKPEALKPTEEATQLRWVLQSELKDYKLENWSQAVCDKLYQTK